MHIKQNEYVDAARVIGDSKLADLPQGHPAQRHHAGHGAATLEMGHVVLVGATLSFIGLAEAGLAEWGNLVCEGQPGSSPAAGGSPPSPALMVFLWALAFNLLGDGLRDVLDPRTEGR